MGKKLSIKYLSTGLVFFLARVPVRMEAKQFFALQIFQDFHPPKRHCPTRCMRT